MSIIPRKNARGETRYRAQIQIRRGGEKVHSESATFSKRKLAEEWKRRRLAELEQLEASGAGVESAHPDRGMTLGEGIGVYLEAVGENFGRSKVAALRALQRMPVADRPVVELLPRDFIDHVHWRRVQPATPSHPRGVGPATLNNDLIFLRLVLRYLRTAKALPVDPGAVSEAVNTLRSARLVSKSSHRERRPSAGELRALDAYFRERCEDGRIQIPMWHLMWLAIYSGRRIEELARLPREGLDRAHGVYQLTGIKDPRGRKASRVYEPLLPPAGWHVVDRILEDFPGETGPLLAFNPKSAGTAWSKACKMLGIVDLRFHDLRHECLSRLAEDGWTIPQIQQVSLHDSWDSLRRYVNMPPRRGERVEFEDEKG